VRGPFVRALIAAASFVLAAAPSAAADTAPSSNWAGYAVHGTGVSFEQVSAQWRQPSAKCVPGRPAYSAAWVGLGGFSETSTALEQIGTELDCGRAGRVLSSAWFELVPEPARMIGLKVRPGDLVAAKVTVTGNRVFVSLSDRTRRRTFADTLYAPDIDVSSAEWIVEAPSDCVSATSCHTLPLADFGTTTFRLAQAVSTTGDTGPINDPAWGRTRIILRSDRTRLLSFKPAQGAATPLALNTSGSSFKVVYSQLAAPGTLSFVRREFLRSTALFTATAR